MTSCLRRLSSCSSAIRNLGSRSIFEKFLFSKVWQNACMVIIEAPDKSTICFSSRFSVSKSLFVLSSSASAECIRERISCAAALVKVTTRSLSTSQSLLKISCLILSTKTLVLPEPAAAATRRFFPLVITAAFCSFVSIMAQIPQHQLFLLNMSKSPSLIPRIGAASCTFGTSCLKAANLSILCSR